MPSCLPMQSPCLGLVAPAIPGADVVGFVTSEVRNFSAPAFPLSDPPVAVSGLDFCNVSALLRHHGADDTVYIDVWLPLDDWNGRYLATGGGGLAAGYGSLSLAVPLSQGFVASSTDGGLTLNNTVDPQLGTWALRSDGSRNDELLLNYASRSIHDTAVMSKDLVRQYFKTHTFQSYYYGCSNGGRQGYVEAAVYPEDFNGILANAPAVQFPKLGPSLYWPAVVMQNGKALPPCVFNAYQEAIVAHCEALDGVKDGFLSDQDSLHCTFNTTTLVGTAIACDDNCSELPCGGAKYTITNDDAEVVAKILEGPRSPSGEFLWYGITPGATFSALALTVPKGGVYIPYPYATAAGYLQFLVLANATYDVSTMTYAEFSEAFEKSISEMGRYLSTDELDFSAFQKAGGKLLTWVGTVDEYIPPLGTLDFRNAVEAKHNGAEATDEFYRLFLAPGVGHCLGGPGPFPSDSLSALVSWVEKGNVPDTLDASAIDAEGFEVTRKLCRYPKKLTYQGGNVKLASSFRCR